MLKHVSRKSLSFLFTLVGLFWLGQPAQAAQTCNEIFRPATSDFLIGALRTSFKHDNHYSNELKESINIKDQCGLGTCHLHAWAGSLEKSYEKRTGKTIKLSTRYLALNQWFERVIQSITDKDPKKVSVELGATPFESRSAVRDFGLIPEGVWEPKVNFDENPIADRYEELIQNRIGRLKYQLEHEIDPQRKHELKENAERDINDLFEQMTGKFPSSFTFEGKEYSPRSFAYEKFPELFDPLVFMFVTNNESDKTLRVDDYTGDILVESNVDTAERLAREAIDSGQTVYLAYDHRGAYVDKKTGIMSISAFNFMNGSRPLSRTQRDFLDIKKSGHAVQIIGYDLDPASGKVKKWKIQNSWGDSVADKGIYHMYADYFRAFVLGITFSPRDSIKLPNNEVHRQIQLGLPLVKPRQGP